MTELDTIQNVMNYLNDRYPTIQFKHKHTDKLDAIVTNKAKLQMTWLEEEKRCILLKAEFERDLFNEEYTIYIHCYEALKSVLDTKLIEMGLIEVEWMK